MAASTRVKVPLAVVEDGDGGGGAPVLLHLPDAALRLNVSTRDQVRIAWQSTPRCVMLIKKISSEEETENMRAMGEWLQRERGVRVLVEPVVARDEMPQFEAFNVEDPGAGVDLIVSCGGDGTLLHISSLFRDPSLAIPPLLAFKGGSLGFLTVHEFHDHRAILDRILLGAVSYWQPNEVSHVMVPATTADAPPAHSPSTSPRPSPPASLTLSRRKSSISTRIVGTSVSSDLSAMAPATFAASTGAGHRAPSPIAELGGGVSSASSTPALASVALSAAPVVVSAFALQSPSLQPASSSSSLSRQSLSLAPLALSSSSGSPVSHSGGEHAAAVDSVSAAAGSPIVGAPPVFVIPRMRLFCRVFRRDAPTVAVCTYQPLNELLVDRGSSAFLSSLELWIDGQLVTNVQADGLIVATPSGSSAYSLSAGGPLVAPTACALLVTPICPHSLSFRPFLLPDCSRIKIRMPDGARASAWASFDGRGQTELRPGDFVEVEMSRNPLPTISFREFNSEWFDSLVSKLGWNVRAQQKPLKPSPTSNL